MPGMDGLALLKRLRELPSTENTPAVFMTARVQPAEVNEYLRMDAIKVVSKPFERLGIAANLESLVAG